MDMPSVVSFDKFVISPPYYEVEHFLTRDFRDAQPLIKEFNYDLSQLDKEDFTEFIQKVFEPEFIELEQGLTAIDIYISKALFPIFKLFTNFIPVAAEIIDINSIYCYCYGHIGSLGVQVCEKPLFDNDGILLNCLGGFNYKTYLRIKEL